MRRTNQGITLIALIITVIVMLVLVAVSVSIIVESDLIGAAEKAGSAYKNAQDKEGTIGLTINGITYQSVEDYLVGSPHNWQYTDETLAEIKCTCTECTKVNAVGKTYTIGQTVAYTGVGKGSSEITGAKSGVAKGIAAGDLSASNYGENGKQTINKDANTTWVVFGIEDTNGNGKNETLLLTTAAPTTDEVTLYGAEAYKYGPEEIDRICKEIYGKDARGMTIEDVNRTLGYTPTGGMYYEPNEGDYKTLTGFETTFQELNTTLENWDYIQAYHNKYLDGKYYTPDFPNGTTDSSKLGEVKIDGYLYYVDDSNVADAVKYMVFGDGLDYFYWLASRGVYANDGYACFGPGSVFLGNAYSYDNTVYSDGRTDNDSYAVRPLVSLTSNIPE